MFFNSLYNMLPIITLNYENGKIISFTNNFKKFFNFDIKIGNYFDFYIENIKEYKDFINQDYNLNFLLKLKINNELHYVYIQKIINRKKLYIILNKIDELYFENKDLKNQNLNLLHNNKKLNKEFKDINKYIEEDIFCIFQQNGDIKNSNKLFNEIYKEKIIIKFFENYADVIYKVNSKNSISFINKYENSFFKCNLLKNENFFILKIFDISDFIFMKEELKSNNEIIVNIIGDFIHEKSEFTANHIKRVQEYTRLLANLYKNNYNSLPDSEIELLCLASALHDIGKFKIENSILEKNGKLTQEEILEMNKHTIYGKEMLDKYNTKNSKLMEICSIVAYEHHEKWNGKGYPLGKKENEIHLYSRIVSIADVFDALISKRPYKKEWKPNEIRLLLLEEKNKSFDPLLIDLIIINFDKFLELDKKYK